MLGSSLIRKFDEKKLENTEIRCLRGAKVSDLAKEAEALSAKSAMYTRVVFLGGGNDASSTQEDCDLEATIDTYRSLVETAKQMSGNVALPAIPPRLKPHHALENIHALNANLASLAQEQGLEFLPTSTLQSKEVTD